MEKSQTLWEAIISFQNMHLAFKKAAKGKRSKPEIAAFEMNLEEQLFILIEELISGQYRPGPYNHFTIHSPKRRLISAAPFRDRVVHHALCKIIEPIFERKFIYDSYANRKGKGTHRALDSCTHYMRRFKYVLPLDIRKFFPNIDHQILFAELGKSIPCQKTLALCQTIMKSGASINTECFPSPSTTNSAPVLQDRPSGLPIGNLTSQFWANVYLNPFNHFIKRELKCKGYVRYVDDMLLFDNDKKQLLVWKQEISLFMHQIQLHMHENSAQARPCTVGLPFLGFQVFPDHRRLKRRKAIHARRRFKSLVASYHAGKIPLSTVDACITSWVSHASSGDTWGLRKNIFQELIL